MRSVVSIAILLIILCGTWTLYLEYDNKRFMELLPKAPPHLTKNGGTTSTPTTAVPENGEGSTRQSVLPVSAENSVVDKTRVTLEHVQEHVYTDKHKDIQELKDGEPVPQVEAEKPPINAEAFEEYLKSHGITIEEYEQAKATIEKIRMNPDNWVRGEPGKVGSIMGLSTADMQAFTEAIYTLNPTESHRKLMERAKISRAPTRIPAPTEQELEGLEAVEFGGGHTVYLRPR